MNRPIRVRNCRRHFQLPIAPSLVQPLGIVGQHRARLRCCQRYPSRRFSGHRVRQTTEVPSEAVVAAQVPVASAALQPSTLSATAVPPREPRVGATRLLFGACEPRHAILLFHPLLCEASFPVSESGRVRVQASRRGRPLALQSSILWVCGSETQVEEEGEVADPGCDGYPIELIL